MSMWMGKFGMLRKVLEMSKTYIGDGVYCEFDGYAFVLTTENGIEITNTIVLEPEVYSALIKYVKFTVDNEDNESLGSYMLGRD